MIEKQSKMDKNKAGNGCHTVDSGRWLATGPQPEQIRPVIHHQGRAEQFGFGHHWSGIYYLEPVYQPEGRNGCRVYYDNGVIEEAAVRVEYVLDLLARQVGSNGQLLRQQSVHWTAGQRQRNVPLVLNEYFILLPVKSREQQRKNDSCVGYVVQQKLSRITARGQGTMLTFVTNPYMVQVYTSVRTMRRSVVLGLELQRQCVWHRQASLEAAQAALQQAEQRCLWPVETATKKS